MSALEIESWIWYAVTWVVVAARMSSRLLLQGSIKKLQIDDAMTLFAMMSDTVLMVTMNIIAKTSSNLIDPSDDHGVMPPEEISERAFGSKMVLVTEQMQLITIWTVKGCLLVMFNRLTWVSQLISTTQNWAVKLVSGYVVLSFVVMEILYFGVWCRPFSQYWAVPPDNIQCSAATNHLITNTIFNISSDILIIMIPMPLLFQSQMAIKKKMILCSVFALGTFTILCAILNKFYSFTQPFGSEWTLWYIRESSTALITASLPLTWTLFRRIFNLRSFNGSSKDHYGARTITTISTGVKSSNKRSNARSAIRSVVTRDNSIAAQGESINDVDSWDSQEEINRAYGIQLHVR